MVNELRYEEFKEPDSNQIVDKRKDKDGVPLYHSNDTSEIVRVGSPERE